MNYPEAKINWKSPIEQLCKMKSRIQKSCLITSATFFRLIEFILISLRYRKRLINKNSPTKHVPLLYLFRLTHKIWESVFMEEKTDDMC